MMDITVICIVGFIVLGIYKLCELFVKRKERMAIIEKLPDFLNNNEWSDSIQLPDISFGKQDYGSWPLRISLLLIGVGLGCAIAFFIQYALFEYVNNQVEGIQFVLYFSFITIFGGLGLFISYLIESKKKNSSPEK
jgi:hypothetical protein